MNIISIIPAWGGSKVFSKKNILQLSGKPLIGWTIEQSINTGLISHTFVTTNCDDIAMIAESFGAEIIRRPDSINEKTASSEASLIHALGFVRDKYHIEPDLIVFLQETYPLRKQNDINDCIVNLLEHESDSVFSGFLLEDFHIWEKSDISLRNYNYDYLNSGSRQNIETKYVENGSIYVFKPSILTKFNNRIGGKISFYEMEFWQTLKLDSPDDIEIVETFLNAKIKYPDAPKIYLNEIDLIIYDFDGVMTDNTAMIDENGKESVRVNRSDGLAISYFRKAGIKQLILSTEKNKVVQKRAEKLQIEYFNNIEDKKQFLLDFVKDHNIFLNKVLYLGNDINDLEPMRIVGIPVCPKDAFPAIREISKIILEKDGGHGVIRNLYEVLK